MKKEISVRALRVTQTGVMVALLIALQALTKPAGQYVTGSCVNAVLAVTALTAGLWSALAVAALSPFCAFFLGIGPQLLPVVPSIAAGNIVFAALLFFLSEGGEAPLWRRTAGWLAAAAAKFGVLYLLVVRLLCTVLALKEAQAAALTAMFSYPQLVTALVGGGIALVLAPVLKKALKR